MGQRDNEAGSAILGLICIAAAVIFICTLLFPYLVVAFILSLLWLGISWYRGDESVQLSAGLSCILLVLTLFTGAIAEFGKTDLGRAITSVAGTVQMVEEAEQNASIAVIDAMQNATSQDDSLPYDIIREGIKNS